MKNPPHLPAQACRVDTYYRLQNVKWLLLFAGLAFVAGASAALMISAWVLPLSAPVVINPAVVSGNAVNDSRPENWLARQTGQRMLTIHDKRKKPGGEFYSPRSLVGQAAIISSDGWAVAYAPDYENGAEKNWEVLDYQLVGHKIETALYDKLDGLLYFKISTEGLRVVSFADWNGLAAGGGLWAVNGRDWQQNFIKRQVKSNNKELVTAWQPLYSFELFEQAPPGDLLFNNQGGFVGLVKPDNLISHGYIMEKQVAPLLGEGRLAYTGLPWQGYFVYDVGEAGQIGFYLEKTAGASAIKKGDVVLQIQDTVVSPENLARLIWLAPEEVSAVVWRAGERLNLTLSKQTVAP